jgi:hypothetical protein
VTLCSDQKASPTQRKNSLDGKRRTRNRTIIDLFLLSTAENHAAIAMVASHPAKQQNESCAPEGHAPE